ncbi:hypothetical protein GWN42_13550 [candidate division KSB1 bacterium]|nr:hypothetical protein [candidate division KSB1 bacterium]
MSTFTSTGYTIDRYDDILNALIADLQSAFGDNIKTNPDSAFGQFARIMSEIVADINESVEGIVSAYDPQKSSGVFLSSLVLLNGIERKESEFSTVTLECTANTAGTTIPAGSLVSDPAIGEQFATDIELIVAPSGTGNVSATAVNAGPIAAVVDTLTQIDTPVYGWESVTNIVDATEGQNEETDPDLRLRRQRAAEQTGTANVAAIFTEIANIPAVEQVVVIQNATEVTDPDGVPPGHIWAIVLGGADNDIAQAIFEILAAGTGMYGDTTVPYADPITGKTYDVTFERPDDVENWIDVTVVKDDDYPPDGDDQIKQALVDYYDEFEIGEDVEYTRLYTPINSVPGHYVSDLKLDTTFPPTGTGNLAIQTNERAVISLPNIRVFS